MEATIPTVPSPLLQQVSERIECLTGLHFPGERFADLERGLARAARELGCRDTHAYVEALLSRDLGTADLEVLADSLTIGETHFFRDPSVFTFFESTLLPDLIAARRGRDQRLRIWSAGCASGEEPYSIAILLHRLLPDLPDWQIAILGTDINPKILTRAAAGVYTEWSFRDTPAWVKPRYFNATSGGRYEIQSAIKRMVRFACLNLVEDVYPSILNNTHGLDLIVCRNVLLYFAAARIPPVVQRFHGALAAGGQLAMGAVEASLMTFPGFTPVPAPGMSLYRKNQSSVISHQSSVISPSDRSPITDHPSLTTDHRPPITDPHSLYAAGRYVEARAALLGGAGPRPDNDPQLAGLLAQCHANLGELAEALLWSERALKMAKTDPTLHFLRAGILRELQRDDEALLALRNVLFLDAGHVLAHFSMANLHRRANRASVAAKHIANVRRLLERRDESEELPQSDGLTVGRLNAILAASAWP